MSVKRELSGNETLFARSEWPETIEGVVGTATQVMGSPWITEAQPRMRNLFKQEHDVAFLALCTSTRPYTAGVQWKTFTETCAGIADPIVLSSGGVIPIQFESDFPFLTYDTGPSPDDLPLYIDRTYAILAAFFTRFHYRKAVFLFMPSKPHRRFATMLREAGLVERTPVLPGPSLWARLNKKVRAKDGRKRTEAFKADGFMWHPLAHPAVQQAVRREILR